MVSNKPPPPPIAFPKSLKYIKQNEVLVIKRLVLFNVLS